MPSYPNLTPDAERHFGPTVAHCIALFNQLAAPETQGAEHAEIEARLREEGNEVLRLGFQGYLDQRRAVGFRAERPPGLPSHLGTLHNFFL